MSLQFQMMLWSWPTWKEKDRVHPWKLLLPTERKGDYGVHVEAKSNEHLQKQSKKPQLGK